MKKRIVAAVLAVLVLLPIAGLIGGAARNGARLTVYNQSATVMDGVSVEVVGYGTQEPGSIGPGGKAQIRFRDFGGC